MLSAPNAVPSTPAALGRPLRLEPPSLAAIKVPEVLAPTIAMFISATAANSAPMDRVRAAVCVGRSTAIAVMIQNVREAEPPFEEETDGLSWLQPWTRKEF